MNPVPVVVIGAGVIGAAIAQSLAARGVGVVLFERAQVAALPAASAASAALLEPLPGADPNLASLARRSLDRLPGLCATLRDRTGIDPGWSRPGTMFVALHPREAEWLRVARLPLYDSIGESPAWLDARTARDLEPALSVQVVGALRIGSTQSVDAPAFTRALVADAASRGATVLAGVGVTGFRREGKRVVAVETDGGEMRCSAVVLAAGAWSASVARLLGTDVPVVPVVPQRGQIMAVVPRATAPRVTHVLHGAGGYAVPKTDGSVLIGATHDDVGFDPSVTPDGLQFLGNLARELVPGIATEPVRATWSGFRPVWRGEDVPPCGPVANLENVMAATGHGAVGMTVAAGVGEVIADLVTGA